MTTEAIHKLHCLGREIYGDQWIGPLSDDLGTRRKSVQDWSTGVNATFTMDHWFWKKVPLLMEIKSHRDAIDRLRREVRR